MTTYTPNNDYVYNQAFSGAVAGLLGQSNSLSNVSGSNTDTIEIAGAWAQEFDTQWGVSTNPDLFEYEEILTFSNNLFLIYEPQPNPEGITPSTYLKSAQALMILLADGESYLASKDITPPPIPIPGPVVNPNLTQDAWWIDPVNGSDANNGFTVETPLNTYAHLAQLLGSYAPRWAQSVTITQLTTQTPGVDIVTFTPTLIGDASLIIQGIPSLVRTIIPTGVSLVAPGPTGTDLTLTVTSTAGIEPGMILHNVTRSSTAVVDAVVGETIVCNQPVTDTSLEPLAFFTVTLDAGWAVGNSIQVLQNPICNIQVMAGYGGAYTNDNTGTIWLANLNMPDASGTAGNSTLPFAPQGVGTVLSKCQVDPYVILNGNLQTIGVTAVCCFLNGGGTIDFASVLCSSLNNNGFYSRIQNISSVDGNSIVHGQCDFKGAYNIVGEAHFDGTLEAAHGGSLLLEPSGDVDGGGTVMWGAASLDAEGANGSVVNNSGGTWANCLQLGGTLTIESIGTGTAYAPGTPGVWTDGIAITTANLDTHGALQNPRTGSRFCII